MEVKALFRIFACRAGEGGSERCMKDGGKVCL